MSGRSRYPGTRPFGDTPEDRAVFFGRLTETEQLYLRVLSVPFLVQFGRSGLGKTSLLQAGLFPRLRERTFLPVMIRLNVPGESIAVTVARSIDQACELERLEPPRARGTTLRELLANTTLWRGDVLLTPVLVFDQFEEVFTLHEAAFRSTLAAEIGGLAGDSRPHLKVVISLREDFLGALEELSVRIPNLFHERIRVQPFSEAAAREAITEPARLVASPDGTPFRVQPFEFDAATLDQMIAYLRGNFGVIEPFQLQLLCRHAEAVAAREQAAGRQPVTLSARSFVGGLNFDHVLRNFYRGTLKELPPPQRRRARRLCEDGLLDRAGHRLMLEEGQIRNEFRVRRESLNVLAQERVLRRERRQESLFYEISHDRLAESIQQSRGFRIPRRLRGTLWTVGIVAPLLVGGLLFRANSLERARARADTERAGAEGFLRFLFSKSALQRVGDAAGSDTGEMREATGNYLRSAGHSEALNRANALSAIGDLERRRGTLSASIKAYGEALEALRVRTPGPLLLRESARVQVRLGDALLDQGKSSKARSAYEDSVRGWRAVIGSGESVPANCTELAWSLVRLAETRERAGEVKDALATVEEAVRLAGAQLLGRGLERGRCSGGSARIVPRLDPAAVDLLGRAVLVRARLFGLADDDQAALRLAAEGRQLESQAGSVRSNPIGTLAWDGPLALQRRLALADARRLLRALDAALRSDPDNRVWQRDRAVAQLLIAEATLACRLEKSGCRPSPSLDEPETMILDALYTLRNLAAVDTTNRSLDSDLIRALFDQSAVLAAEGRSAERLVVLREAEQLASASADRVDLDSDRTLADLRVRMAEALMGLGRDDEAKEMLRRAINTLGRLVAVKPENPLYALDTAGAHAAQAALLRRLGDEPSARLSENEAARFRSQADLLVKRYGGVETTGEELEPALLRQMELLPSSHRTYDRLRSVYEGMAVREREQTTGADNAARARRESDAWNAALHSAQLASLLAAPESSNDMKAQLRRTLGAVGRYLERAGRLEEELAVRDEEVTVATELADSDPHRPNFLRGLAAARIGLAEAAREAHRPGWEWAQRSAIVAAARLGGEVTKQKGSDCQRALEAFRKAASLDPADEEAREAVRQLGNCERPSPARSGL